MPVIKHKVAFDKVLSKPVFTVEDIVHENVPRPYAKKQLHELVKRGKIRRVERNKYTTLDDPIAVAAHVTSPCYVSMWSAMSIRGLTTQVPFAVEVVTSRRRFRREINFIGTQIVFYTVKPMMMFGYENVVWKANIRIPLAKPEKIIIDALYFRTVPLEELTEVVKASNISLLIEYAKLTGEKNIIRKVKELVENVDIV